MTAPRTFTVTRPPAGALPESFPAWDRARRRADAVRDWTGRAATLAGTATAAAVVVDPGLTFGAVLATAGVTAAGTAILRLSAPWSGHQKATATTLYTMPGVSLTVLLAGEWAAAGGSWAGTQPMRVLAVAVWAGGTWLLRPARIARRMVTPRPPAAPPPAPPAPVEDLDLHPAALWWRHRVAAEGGPAVGTVLEDITQAGPRAMTAIIRAAAPGMPVPDISVRRLSALIDVPEDQITIKPVPGRGAGLRRLSIGAADQADADPVTVWTERIAPAAMPGAVLTGIRIGKPGATTSPADTPATIDMTGEDA